MRILSRYLEFWQKKCNTLRMLLYKFIVQRRNFMLIFCTYIKVFSNCHSTLKKQYLSSASNICLHNLTLAIFPLCALLDTCNLLRTKWMCITWDCCPPLIIDTQSHLRHHPYRNELTVLTVASNNQYSIFRYFITDSWYS